MNSNFQRELWKHKYIKKCIAVLISCCFLEFEQKKIKTKKKDLFQPLLFELLYFFYTISKAKQTLIFFIANQIIEFLLLITIDLIISLYSNRQKSSREFCSIKLPIDKDSNHQQTQRI